MLELDKIVFEVDTSSLKEAVTQVGKLGEALGKVNKPMKEVSASAKDTSSGIEKVTQSNAKAIESSSKVEAQIKKEAIALSILRGEAIKLADETSANLGKGFTKAQSGQLASLTMQGASKEELKTITEIISQRNKLMGTNPFDKSADGLEKLKQKSVELSQVTTLMNKGLSLSKTEIELLARDIESLTQKEARGLISKAELSSSLQKLQADYVRYSSEVAKSEAIITQSEKDRKAQALANAEVQKALHQQEMLRKQAEIALAKQQEKGTYIAQGYSPQSSAVAAGLKISGVPEESIGAYLRQAKATEEANKQARAYAKSIEYLEIAENRLNARLAEGNQQLGTRYTDELTKYQRALTASGVSADIASKKMEVFKDKLEQVAGRERAEQMRYLSRALSVQMGDVAVSLASGMNPLIVMMQQGDQIRGVIQQTGAAGKELQTAMSGAALQIGKSFKDTGIAIGSFFLGAIKTPIVGIANIIGSVLQPALQTVPRALQNAKLASEALGKGDALKMFASTLLTAGMNVEQLKVGLASLGKVGIVAVIALLATLGIALKQTLTENSALNKSLALGGSLLGLNYGKAESLSVAMTDLGITSSKAVKGFTEISKYASLIGTDFEGIIVASRQAEKHLGVDMVESIKQFASIASKPSEALGKIALETGKVESSVMKNVRALERQGKAMEASKLATDEYKRVLEEASKVAEENTPPLIAWFDSLIDRAGKYYDKLKLIAGLRNKTIGDEIERLEGINASQGSWMSQSEIDRNKAEIERLKSAQDAKNFYDNQMAKYESKQAESRSNEERWQQTINSHLNEYEQRAKKIAEYREQASKATTDQGKLQKLINNELKQYTDELSNQKTNFDKFKESLDEINKKRERATELKNPTLSYGDKAYIEAYNSMYDSLMDKSKSFTDARIKAVEQLDKARKGGAGGEEIAKAIQVVNQALILEAQAYGLVGDQAKYAGDEARRIADENRRWTTGALSAMQKYTDEATNLATQVESAFSNAFRGMEDALLNFVNSGKLNFKDLTVSILNDINRIIIRQAIIAPLVGMATGILGGMISPSSVSLGSGVSGASLGGVGSGTGGIGINPSSSGVGIRAYDVGTNYVPYDQLALIHKGEAVVPAKYNPAAGGVSGSGETVNNVSINVNVASDGTATVNTSQGANQLGVMISNAVTAELIRQKRNGGLLSGA